jgi:phospholipase C/DNA-binding beta-propeller fold protein YncE
MLLPILLLAQTVGPQPGGVTLLNTGWRIQPAGVSVPVGTTPMSRVTSADGKMLFVLNGGFQPPSISVLDTVGHKELQRVPLANAWRGLALAADGRTLYASLGPLMRIARFTVDATGKLTAAGEIDLSPIASEAGQAHLLGDLIVVGDRLLVADLPRNRVQVIRLGDGGVDRSIATGSGPYALLADPKDVDQVWISHWTGASIASYRISTGEALTSIATGPHPTEMAWIGSRLAVATANTNYVEFHEKRQNSWKPSETVNLAFTPKQPVGMTPSALALSPDGKTLATVCSDANTVALIDVSRTPVRVSGYLPAGWYPTGAAWVASGQLAVLNGRGGGSKANPGGPQPSVTPNDPTKVEYVLRIQNGTVQFVAPWDAAALTAHSARVLSLTPYRDTVLRPQPLPVPIKHVILLMKENRTYDQVLGDLPIGNGDKSLVLFGEAVTPNHHQLAREFALLDNFYVNADVSADGYYWTTSAIAPDTTQKTMPMSYARRGPRGKAEPTKEGIRTAPGGHIWDTALRAGKTIRNYGFSAVNLPEPPPTGIQIARVNDPVLAPHTAMNFRQHDRAFSDQIRMQVVIDDLRKWEREGGMPDLTLITIGNDHTEGTKPGACTPQSCVADNDQAFGMLVEALSNSKFWKDTALFVLEDDAQNGPDHVDSHRSPAYVISAYSKRGVVDSTLYSTISMLRTIEEILGLPPMTHFDAAAPPMTSVFQSKPDLRPYKRLPALVSLTDKNPEVSTTARRSAALDFDGSDRIDDAELNDILYLAIQGRPAPAPVRSRFVASPLQQ